MDAMRAEMDSIMRNQVWKLVDLPPQSKSIRTQVGFKIKHRTNEMIDKFKVYLLAKGFTQIEGVNYEETFSPAVRIASIRLILALVAPLDLELIQMDVKTAFLNGSLEKEIYMDQSLGLYQKVNRTKFVVLKDLFMVSNSLLERGIRFHEAIISFGLSIVSEHHYVYVKKTMEGIMFLTLYVDDILLAGNNMEMIQTTKK